MYSYVVPFAGEELQTIYDSLGRENQYFLWRDSHDRLSNPKVSPLTHECKNNTNQTQQATFIHLCTRRAEDGEYEMEMM